VTTSLFDGSKFEHVQIMEMNSRAVKTKVERVQLLLEVLGNEPIAIRWVALYARQATLRRGWWRVWGEVGFMATCGLLSAEHG
jgi:hypothetical protein